MYRYDPVGTFREIKSAIDTKFIKLTNKRKNTKTNSIHEMIKKEKKVRSTSAYPYIANSFRANAINSMKIKIENKEEEDKSHKILKEEEQKEKTLRNKKLRKRTNRFYKETRKFFLTNDGQKRKLKNKGMGENDANNSSNKNKNNSFNKKYLKTGNNKLNDSFDKYSSKDLNSIDKEILLEMYDKILNKVKIKSIQRKKLIDLQISKNRDKLIKTNGLMVVKIY